MKCMNEMNRMLALIESVVKYMPLSSPNKSTPPSALFSFNNLAIAAILIDGPNGPTFGAVQLEAKKKPFLLFSFILQIFFKDLQCAFFTNSKLLNVNFL